MRMEIAVSLPHEPLLLSVAKEWLVILYEIPRIRNKAGVCRLIQGDPEAGSDLFEILLRIRPHHVDPAEGVALVSTRLCVKAGNRLSHLGEGDRQQPASPHEVGKKPFFRYPPHLDRVFGNRRAFSFPETISPCQLVNGRYPEVHLRGQAPVEPHLFFTEEVPFLDAREIEKPEVHRLFDLVNRRIADEDGRDDASRVS